MACSGDVLARQARDSVAFTALKVEAPHWGTLGPTARIRHGKENHHRAWRNSHRNRKTCAACRRARGSNRSLLNSSSGRSLCRHYNKCHFRKPSRGSSRRGSRSTRRCGSRNFLGRTCDNRTGRATAEWPLRLVRQLETFARSYHGGRDSRSAKAFLQAWVAVTSVQPAL